jgi:UPF0755 protein
MPQRSSSSIFRACGVPGFILLILFVLLLIFIPRLIVQRAERLFGPPSTALTERQRFSLSAMLVWQADDLSMAANPGETSLDFSILSGESVASITQRLWQAGLISNPAAFRSYLQYTGLDTSLQAGNFTLSYSMTPIEIAQELQSSIAREATLVILAGWRLEEIANALPTSGLTITPEQFIQAVHTRPAGYSFSSELPDDSLEGFLFPDSYVLPRETTIEQLIPVILNNFEQQVSPELRAGFTHQSLSLFEAITLASIIEREAIFDEEMPLIASVFYNRLAVGQRLASDPTVQYALGYNEAQGVWWTNPLSLSDLEIDSPYNTYLYTSLPPGPICNPGIAALRSVAFPAQTPYYYFRAACDGSGHHVFAENYEQHLANECP